MSQIFACSLSDQLIEFAGADKKSYLHGQITQDINLINHETMLWAGHCSGKGKLWAVHKLFAHNDSYFSITSADSFEQSLAELKKYAVFAKVTISHNTEFKLIGLFGDNLQPALAALNINFQGNSAAFQFGHAIKLSDDRIILIVKDTPESFLNDIAIWLDNDFTWQSLAILHGEPSLNTSAVGEYVPQMVNLQAIGGISFRQL